MAYEIARIVNPSGVLFVIYVALGVVDPIGSELRTKTFKKKTDFFEINSLEFLIFFYTIVSAV